MKLGIRKGLNAGRLVVIQGRKGRVREGAVRPLCSAAALDLAGVAGADGVRLTTLEIHQA